MATPLVRFRPCEAFAAGAALVEAPHRAAAWQRAGLLELFPAGPVRQALYLVASAPNVAEIDPSFLFEDPWLLAQLVRQLRDPWGHDDALKRAFADVVDYAAIERLGAQWCAPLPAALRDDGRALLDTMEAERDALPDVAREEAAMALHGSPHGVAA